MWRGEGKREREEGKAAVLVRDDGDDRERG